MQQRIASIDARVPRAECRVEPLSRQSLFAAVGRAALQSLHQELSAYPKPGLVSPVDNGSHDDMDAATFFRSLFSLRSYFREIALAGTSCPDFAILQQLGLAAEQRMLRATQGVNTHRGAVFNLGLLAAGSGYLLHTEGTVNGRRLSALISDRWGDAILRQGASLPKTSHGSQVALRYGVGGAREEAAAGFPHVFEVGLPALLASLQRHACLDLAAIQCLFHLVATLPDTNLLYRGGEKGLLFAQTSAREFLDHGGVHRQGWRAHAIELHLQFIEHRLSPGGSADLLAATLFVYRVQRLAASS
jgi:triphosphoribosyl-dephospho-CoA synthase